jgi:hypothetical protein
MSVLILHAGTASERLLGHYFIPPRLTGLYLDFLRNFLPEMLQDANLQTGIHLKIVHYSAPPHLLLTFRQFLNRVYPEQRMGRDGQRELPARSPDLNPLYSYLRGHLHSTVCATEVSDVEYWQQRTQTGRNMILSTPEIFQPVMQSLFRHATKVLRLNSRLTVNIYFNRQAALAWKQCFRMSNIIKYFCCCCFIVAYIHFL